MAPTTAARMGIVTILLIVLLALSGTSASAGSTLRGRDVDNEENVDRLADAGTANVNWRSLQDEESSAPTASPTPALNQESSAPTASPTPATNQDVCSNGTPGIQTGNACCMAECGACGGSGCSDYGDGLGEDNCCRSNIEQSGELCSVSKKAPCVVDVCSDGTPGIQTGNVCCMAECGACGGPGCSKYGDSLGAAYCCQSNIEAVGVSCSHWKAPCVVDGQ